MTVLAGVIACALVGWFAAGTIYNVRRGSAVMRWMQAEPHGGLRLLGGRASVRWLGSTVVELTVRDAEAPFTSAAVVVFLEPRDLPWWPLSRLRGRRDTLILRGELRRAPAIEFEALDPQSWSGRDALPRVPQQWPQRVAAVAAGLDVRPANDAALERAETMLAAAGRTGLAVRRLSVRSTAPNFQLHLGLPDDRQSAHDFFQSVRSLAEAAIG